MRRATKTARGIADVFVPIVGDGRPRVSIVLRDKEDGEWPPPWPFREGTCLKRKGVTLQFGPATRHNSLPASLTARGG